MLHRCEHQRPATHRLEQGLGAGDCRVSLAARVLPQRPSIRKRFAIMFVFSRWICLRAVAPAPVALNWLQKYIATQFALAGLEPAGENGSYLQRVPLFAVHTLEDKTKFAFVPA